MAILPIPSISTAQLLPPSGMPSNYSEEDDTLLKAWFGRGVQSDTSGGWIAVPDKNGVPTATDMEWEPASGPAANQIYGAVVIANKNDSDSDGYIDLEEGGHLPASAPTAKKKVESTNQDGRTFEVDLIKIVITLPKNSHGTLGSNTGQIRFWKDDKKNEVLEVNGLPNSVCTSANLNNPSETQPLTITAYAEVPAESSQLNDMAIWYEDHTNEKYDLVRVSAIWSGIATSRTSRPYYTPITRHDANHVNVTQSNNYGVGDQLIVYVMTANLILVR